MQPILPDLHQNRFQLLWQLHTLTLTLFVYFCYSFFDFRLIRNLRRIINLYFSTSHQLFIINNLLFLFLLLVLFTNAVYTISFFFLLLLLVRMIFIHLEYIFDLIVSTSAVSIFKISLLFILLTLFLFFFLKEQFILLSLGVLLIKDTRFPFL